MDRDDRQPDDILRQYGLKPDDATDDSDLLEVALALAALETPERLRTPYRRYVRGLVEETRVAAAGALTAADRAAALSGAIGARAGFTGDRKTYDSLENANLMAVIDRKRGLPVALGILYIHVARALGWPACGLNFPAHFLVRVDGNADRAVIDPFNDGAVLTPAGMRRLLKTMAGAEAELKPAHYAPVSDRALLLRLQNNIKVRRLKAGDFPGAIDILRRMLLLAPLEPETWYDLAILEIHRGQTRAGRDALEKCLGCLDMRPDASELRDRVLKTLRELDPSME